jgi:hypothetical protein
MSIPDSYNDFGSVDDSYSHDKIDKQPGELNRRSYTYFLLGSNQMILASLARLALIKVCCSIASHAD